MGHDQAKDLLLKACRRQRVSHAYLFKGPVGVGKKSLARAFAAFLNCRATESALDSCGSCASCKKFISGNHPDFLTIEPDGSMIKIGQIRELKKDLAFPPFEDGYRVVLLPDIHDNMPRKEVNNSLLKILEEPPPQTVFILTVDEAGAVLPTIVSRCQIIPCHALAHETLGQLLVESGLQPDTANTLAAISEGSLGRARMLADKDLLEIRRLVVESLCRIQEGRPGTVETVFQLAAQCVALKDDLHDFLGLLKLWIRDLYILAGGGGENHIINQDLRHTYGMVKQRWNLSDLSDKMQRLKQAKKELAHNCNKSLVIEVLLWELIREKII